MKTWSRKFTLAVLTGVLLMSVGTASEAQENPEEPAAVAAEAPEPEPEARPLKTIPPDWGYGHHQLLEQQHFAAADELGRVDRRSDIDAMADRAILWPQAYIPAEGTISYSNYFFAGNQVSYAVSDDTQLTATVVIPFDDVDLLTGLSAKFKLKEEVDYIVSLQPFGMFHKGYQDLDVSDFGLGIGLLADFYLSDDLVFGSGLFGYGTIGYTADSTDYSECETRDDFLRGTCTRVVSDTTFGPSGGHWLSANISATWYILDQLSLRFETITGVAAGSFLGTEFLYDGSENIREKVARFEDPEVAIGIPFGSSIAFGGGLAWSNHLLGVQFSGYAYRGDPDIGDGLVEEEWLLTPMLNGSVAF